MGNIPASDARNLFTKVVADVYKESTMPKSFLRSFFETKEYSSKTISIEVQRGTEKIAVDVLRGSEGNRNIFSRSTEKMFEPPYYREFFDATQLDVYDRMFGSGSISDGDFTRFLESVVEKLLELQFKIERSYEKQCADSLLTGIITVAAGTNIDFKRKATSLVDKGAGAYWATNTVNPFTDLEAGCNFLRQKGKYQGDVVNAILGSSALTDFLGNEIVQKRGDIKNITLDSIREPQRNSVGGSLHGEVTAGAFRVRLWSYGEFYDDAAGTSTSYIDSKKVILLPENPRFKLAFAAVPQLIDEENPAPKKGAFIFEDYKDKKAATHEYHVKSAGVAIPVAVDQIYTLKAVS